VGTKRGVAPAPVAASVVSVLVVDDHRSFAEALGVVFGLERDLRVEIAANGLQAVAIADRSHPDVVLMDLEMPGISGMETIRRIRSAHPGTRVVVLSSHDDDLTKGEAVAAGAEGFVSKLAPLEELAVLVRRVGLGETIIERSEAARLLRVLRRRRHQEATERQRVGRLTPRQTQILQMMADGAGAQEIARRLNLSRNTFRTHVQNILTRLSVHTKGEAIAVGIRHGKISAGD
jgi:DNA-binding NarL/FixJ family response regulator